MFEKCYIFSKIKKSAFQAFKKIFNVFEIVVSTKMADVILHGAVKGGNKFWQNEVQGQTINFIRPEIECYR